MQILDASDFAIGGVLFQTEGEQLQPLAFFSRKLSETEKGYSAYDRELFAAEFFDSSPMDSSPVQLVGNLKSHFDSIRPSPASNNSKKSVFVHPALKDCSHVFIRNDTVKKNPTSSLRWIFQNTSPNG
ncbi:hypothetical protein TNCV_683341 [Trichonephila clavipes]|nr:hypothetical protein TNCV_683341 [Trichonephila clavipes]